MPAKANTAAAVYAKAPRRVQLNMLRDVGADQMVEALVDGVKQGNSAAEVAAVKAQTEQLASIMKSIGQLKEGNVLTFDFVDDATKVGLNGAAKGSIPGDAFNKALMNAWLGDNAGPVRLEESDAGRIGRVPDFWRSCGYRLLTTGADGRLTLTDDFLRASLLRPELAPVPESCAAELALHDTLMTAPRGAVGDPSWRRSPIRTFARTMRSGCAFARA